MQGKWPFRLGQVVLFAMMALSCMSQVALDASGQMTLSERIAQHTRDRVASASNHAVVNKNAEKKKEATKPKPQPKKRASYTQQKKNAEALRKNKKSRRS
jgi:hypothetical protein